MDFKKSREVAEIAMSVIKDQIRSFHEDCRELLKMEIDEDTIHRPLNVSRTVQEKLTQASIGELSMDQQNEGKFVLVRVLEEGYSRAECSWFNVVDDPDGNVIGLALYNYPLDEVFVPGTVLTIKEPYCVFKVNYPFIRCDCPTDIIVLLPSHPSHHLAKSTKWKNPIVFEDPVAFYPVPRSSGEWKARGNELFKENKLVLAREAYFLGRKMCSEYDPNGRPILLNLLQVHLNLGYYDWVIEEAKKLPKEDKALFRMGKAYYMLRKYEEALFTFRDTIVLLKETGKLELKEYKKRVDETRDMLEQAETRMKESRGEFSMDRMLSESKKNPFQEIDCADFCVPLVLTEISDKGLGLIIKTEAKKGDILMIAKSLATAFRNERDVEKDATEMENLENKSKVNDDGLRARVVSKLTHLVLKNPEGFGSMLYDLHPGNTESEPFQLFCDLWEKREPICEVNRINHIYVNNGFTMLHNECNARIGSGIFYMPSFLNHSCEPNVDYDFYNDVMIVTALEDIADGTELTITYVLPELNYQERTDYFKERGFVCTCPKCLKKV